MEAWMIVVNAGALLCALGTFASSVKSIWCFPIWIVANVVLATCDVHNCLNGQPVWGRVALDVLQFGISVFGWWNWSGKKKRR